MLVFVGSAIGSLLSMDKIRHKFFFILMIVPLLALIDLWLAKSTRRFSYWFRACTFELGTVFGVAVIVRSVLDKFRISSWI